MCVRPRLESASSGSAVYLSAAARRLLYERPWWRRHVARLVLTLSAEVRDAPAANVDRMVAGQDDDRAGRRVHAPAQSAAVALELQVVSEVRSFVKLPARPFAEVSQRAGESEMIKTVR